MQNPILKKTKPEMKINTLLLPGIICLGLHSHIALAQKPFAPIDSKAIIEEGIKLHDDQRYNSAIAKYMQVDRNDTNYIYALTEKSLSEMHGQDYEACVATIRQALAIGGEKNPEMYINMGTALDNLDKKEEAIAAYDEGIAIFPKNHLLYFNKAVTLYDLERYDEAIATLKKTLEINPYHPGTHLLLGTIAANEGRTVQALLSLNAFLLMEPEGDRALSALQYMDALAAGTAEEPKPKGIKLSDGDDYEDIELIIKNKVALSSKYKVKSDFDFPIVKQNQVLFEKLEYDKADKGFWMQFYVPFFRKLYEENKFEDYSMYMLLSSTNDKVKAAVKKHISDLKDFNDWRDLAWSDLHNTHTEMLNGKKQEVTYYYLNGHLQFVGNSKSKGEFIPVGDAEVYHDTGALAAVGKYENGLRTGFWTYYNDYGVKNEMEEYSQGKLSGKYVYYYDTGIPATEAVYKDDKLNGEVKRYFRSGDLLSIENYKDNKQDGRSTGYYRNGQKEYDADYKDGMLDGQVNEFYADGAKESESTFKADKKTGKATTYYRNGKLRSEYTYVDGKPDGAFKSYHPNGNVSEEGTDKDGYVVGEYKIYSPDGKLNEVTNYDASGKLNGTLKSYDADEKLYYEWEYTKGEITAYKYYNKKGEIVGQGKRKLTKFPFTGFYPDGTKKFEGDYEGSQQNGVWKYFDRYGNVETENNYKNGELNGVTTEYYGNGKVKNVVSYTDGLMEGYYASYYINGQLETHGNYKNGKENGDWYVYYIDGTLQTHDYFLYGAQKGWQAEYDVNGHITDDGNYVNDFPGMAMDFDSTGKVIDTVHYEAATLLYKENDYRGKPAFEGNYRNAQANGAFTWYNHAGKVITSGSYLAGKRDGKWTWYHDNGKVKSEAFYDLGSGNGIWNDYYENGQLSYVRIMYQNDVDGEFTRYHSNGKVFIKGQYAGGLRNGAFYYYDEAGQLQIIKYYEYGVQTGYSYNGTDGKEVAVIPVVNGSGKITGYYQNGKKSVEYTLVNGSIDGTYTDYFSSGSIWEETNYTLGYNNGPRKLYLLNGKVEEEENYVWDELSGVAKYYTKEGKLKETITYKSGVKHGVSQKYNASTGKAEKTIVYYDGTIASEK